MSTAILAPVPAHVNPTFPRLAAPDASPWYYRLNAPTDAELSAPDAAALAGYEAWLDEQALSADYDERAARAADELEYQPAEADCSGFTLGSWDAPRELTYVPDEAGVMFVDDVEPPYEPAYL